MKAQPTVFIVDDDKSIREALRWLLETVPLPVETFPSAEQFLVHYEKNRPGCLVLDVKLGGMGGLELQARLGSLNIHLPVIIISGHADVPIAVRGLKAGAVDFLEKPFSDDALLTAIQRAMQFDAQLRAERAWRSAIACRLNQLTSRERGVLDGFTSGKHNKTIAEELGISVKTVDYHKPRILKKMEAESIAELVRIMIAAQGTDSGSPGR